MIGTRTPFRVSFAGGGTDLYEFYSRMPGRVVSTTINKYMYILIHPYFDEKNILIKYSKTELVDHIKDIKHPIVKNIIEKFNIRGIDINSIADIPAGSGLGSSSAYTVGMLNALYAYQNESVTPEKLAKDACEIEIDRLKEPIGKQDQYASAYGGLNYIKFMSDETVHIEPIVMNQGKYEMLQENLLLFFTGKTRSASRILEDQTANMKSNNESINSLKQMAELADEMKYALINSDLNEFGNILNENWKLKKSLSPLISNDHIDSIYQKALKNGALGGKLLGAGGEGFILFYCEKENHSKLINGLKDLRVVNFRFENNGSQIIYNENTRI